MPGTLSHFRNGSNGYACAYHFSAPYTAWGEVTQRLQSRLPIVKVLLYAMKMDRYQFEKGKKYLSAQEKMQRLGRPELAPQIRKERIKRYNIRTRSEETIDVVRDETQHLPLWIQRLFDVLDQECIVRSDGKEQQSKEGLNVV
jgi:hypothetical protein